MGLVSQLLSRADLKSSCPNGEEHRWRVYGETRATGGDNIVVNFLCSKCDKRTSAFITRDQYKLYEKQLGGTK